MLRRRALSRCLSPSVIRRNRLSSSQACERLESRIALHGEVLHGRFDAVPDFGSEPTTYSVSSGEWSQPQTWSTGQVPRKDDVVAITAGTMVVYDQHKSPALDTVAVFAGGHLTFQDGTKTHLVTANLLVMADGRLTIGTADDPIDADATSRIVIRDKAIDTDRDPTQWGTGVVVFGTIDVFGAEKTPFVRLAEEARAGDMVVTLESAPQGWRSGDIIVIPESRQFDYGPGGTNQQLRTEKAVVSGVDGVYVTLATALAFDHLGARNAAGEIAALPHAANVTRNITFASENATGTRGHTAFLDRADVDVHYAAFEGLGRTTN